MSDIGREFMERTRYCCLSPSDQMRGRPAPPLELEQEESKPLVELPGPDSGLWQFRDVTVRDAIESRRSLRSYGTAPLSLEELSYLLWCTQGVRNVVHGSATLRNVPSAGARHAFETCLLINNVKSLDAGLYRYLALGHSLQQCDTSSGLADKVVHGCLGQDFVKSCAVTFIWTALPYRMTWRYSERGYRYLFIDVGHVCQNLYISAADISCGVCAIAAFSDEDMNSILGLDGIERFVIYVATVGKLSPRGSG
jgi:SagB-type dehydrogenase family enzyme